jgi:hypothetical protein
MLTKVHFMPKKALKKFCVSKWNFQRKYRESFAFSTSAKATENASYFHQLGPEPLKFSSIGQVLKQTAIKYPDREALVSCSENSRLTFAEALDKVNKKLITIVNNKTKHFRQIV